MDCRASRAAALTRESIAFEVSPGPGYADEDVRWFGGGDPAEGSGRRFVTTFDAGGTFEVLARCGEDSLGFPVAIADVDAWLARAQAFFGPSVDLSRVRVTTSRLVFGRAGTAWTCNDVNRFKRPARPEDLPSEATLIHELGHVWEHQSGQAQLLRGVMEQVGRWFGRDPYDFGGPEGVHRAASLTSFAKEAQAQIVTELWKSQRGFPPDRLRVPQSTPGYADDLRRLVQDAGIGARAPTDGSVWGKIDARVAWIVNHVVDLAG